MRQLAVLLVLSLVMATPTWGAVSTDSRILANVESVIQANNDFAFDLYTRLRDDDGNLFYSPYSISTALAMTSAGANGKTAEQMAKVLHFSFDSKQIHSAFAELIHDLTGNGLPRDFQLNVAQSLWGDSGLAVRPEFQSLIHAKYGARLGLLNFQDHPEEARVQINRWVEERTNDKIKELLQKNDIDPLTRMVLVNAIYFKATWQKPFPKSATNTSGVFHAGTKDAKTAMMHQTEQFNYGEENGVQVLELPYAGGELSMVVLLPRQVDGLGKLEQSLTAARLDVWLNNLSQREVAVELPRFKVETRFDLAQELQELGMPLAFSGEADFSGISETEKLRISKVIHQAFVGVNESGTEAAAATAVVLQRAAIAENTVAFKADHPFLFLVRDNRTHSILFLGRLTNPSSGTDKVTE
jgi:serpin B